MNQNFTIKVRHLPYLGNLWVLFAVFSACLLLLGSPTYVQQGTIIKIAGNLFSYLSCNRSLHSAMLQ